MFGCLYEDRLHEIKKYYKFIIIIIFFTNTLLKFSFYLIMS
jgi:hypothetical protein